MSLRIRRQLIRAQSEKRTPAHSVQIISVDQFTQQAKKLDSTHTEREHLLRLLNTQQWEQFCRIGNYLFWLEKK